MIALSPTRAPAKTTAPAPTMTPGPSSSAGGASFGADERAESFGGLPSTTWSPISQASPTTLPSWMTTWQPSRTPSPSFTSAPRTSPGAKSDGCTRRTVVTAPPALPRDGPGHVGLNLGGGEGLVVEAHLVDQAGEPLVAPDAVAADT